MPRTVTVEDTAGTGKLPHQLAVLHRTIAFSLWCSGTSSMIIMRYASRRFASSSSRVSPCVMMSGRYLSVPTQNFCPFQ